MNVRVLNKLYTNELQLLSAIPKDSQKRWQHLERLHVIGQQFLSKHFQVHLMMLKQAFIDKNTYEILGQLLRLSLVFPGYLFGKLPIGNVGSARVSAFKKMEIPEDLKIYFDQPGDQK